ncbi:MotA/TolQ/ExbB proton channel family protein [Fontimonas sp. SYSU GA230001]|uniref:MotA/TolQ/ExbB proton channel family protein n=1 Tax=Fontimonas sp. SYSU GA230001 TaxID=3142450 RepID=UPI0032B46191
MLLEWLRLGGLPMALLLVLSLAAATVAIVKFWELWEWRYTRLSPAWRHARVDLALAQLGAERSPLAAVLAAALAALADPGVSEAQARERTEQAAAAALERLRRGLRLLEVIAQLSPLLGLFGTVLGMIDSFRALQDAGGDVQPALLAAGIWQALLTTAAGLAIAIPVIAALGALERLVDDQRLALEMELTRLFTQPRAQWRHAA